MKKHFLTGLAILLPAVVTIIIVLFLVNLLTNPFLGVVEDVFRSREIVKNEQLIYLISKIIALVLIVAITLLIGVLGRLFLTRYFFNSLDAFLHRIPIINKIYRAAQDVVHTLFDSKEKKFSQVVLVPFPYASSSSIGLVTNDCLPEGSDEEHAGLMSVFVPASPNPTMGFMLMFRREQVAFLDIKVEDALKIIISCGVMADQLQKNGGIQA